MQDKFFNTNNKKFITNEAIKSSATKLVPKNSIAIVTRVGVGKLALIPYTYATSQDFLSLSDLKVDLNFAVYAFYKKIKSELSSMQGTAIKGITKSNLLEMKISIPKNKKEQVEIGNLFKNIDKLIDAFEEKIKHLQEQKKALLQQMFI
jgi:type I restriction enzyme S subunit